jgi:hypothetical protein
MKTDSFMSAEVKMKKGILAYSAWTLFLSYKSEVSDNREMPYLDCIVDKLFC